MVKGLCLAQRKTNIKCQEPTKDEMGKGRIGHLELSHAVPATTCQPRLRLPIVSDFSQRRNGSEEAPTAGAQAQE